MHNIGDNIVYGAVGVMTIIDIKEELVFDDKKKYYLLAEYGSQSSSVTFVPCDNAALVSLMRSILSRDDALAAIDRAAEMPDLEWVQDNRARNDKFKKIMESGDRAMILALIRLIYKAGLLRAADGKKNFLVDENAGKRAEKLIASEFSISLGISEAEVREIIDERIKRVGCT